MGGAEELRERRMNGEKRELRILFIERLILTTC